MVLLLDSFSSATMREPVHPDGMQPRRGQCHLEPGVHGWVPLDRSIQVLTDPGPGSTQEGRSTANIRGVAARSTDEFLVKCNVVIREHVSKKR
jgi:hypothetical protein